MKILGIHDGHDASAALMINDEIIAAAQEERFADLKGDYGYPKHSVDFCLKFAGLSGKDLDCVALSSKNSNPVLTYLKRNANFSVSDWVEEQEKFWKPMKFENKVNNYFKIFGERAFRRDQYYNFDNLLSGYMTDEEMNEFLNRRIAFISKELGVPEEKINVTNHETNHKCYALFASRFRSEPVLVLTTEGIGDRFNATVSVYKDGRIQTLKELTESRLGHIYMYATLILGMKPAQHEYKVMGLAPYSNDYETDKAYKVFRKILKVDGIEIKMDKAPRDLYYEVRDQLKDCRFDGIAGGVQKFLEEILCEWVKNCIEYTGVRKVVMAGGVAQNIKAVKTISELSAVDDIFVPPAAGDTSNSLGACYNLAYQNLPARYDAHLGIKPLENIYLGPEFTEDEIFAEIKQEGLEKDFVVKKDAANKDVARLLAEGKVIGVLRGRMEFGLRALGNRSIIANPSDPLIVARINRQIKNRDFWMPFTPSILKERAEDYIKNPKGLYSPYMTMAFDSVEENQASFIAAMHPADKTVRPQLIEREKNTEYYDLIKEFEKLTGHGVILNTSFNLHGKPVVAGPKEAIFTFKNSGLDALLLENTLILR